MSNINVNNQRPSNELDLLKVEMYSNIGKWKDLNPSPEEAKTILQWIDDLNRIFKNSEIVRRAYIGFTDENQKALVPFLIALEHFLNLPITDFQLNDLKLIQQISKSVLEIISELTMFNDNDFWSEEEQKKVVFGLLKMWPVMT